MCLSLDLMNTVNQFAAGFESGVFRVFDIEKTCVIQETRFHDSPVETVKYSPDDKLLVVADKNSFYCVFDAQRDY